MVGVAGLLGGHPAGCDLRYGLACGLRLRLVRCQPVLWRDISPGDAFDTQRGSDGVGADKDLYRPASVPVADRRGAQTPRFTGSYAGRRARPVDWRCQLCSLRVGRPVHLVASAGAGSPAGQVISLAALIGLSIDASLPSPVASAPDLSSDLPACPARVLLSLHSHARAR